MTNTTHKIEIYSTPTCHFCHMAKEFLDTYNVPFTDYNVASDIEKRKEMVEKSGQLGVPVIVVDDKNVIVGFDREHLADLVGIKA
jgi:glutaredoxin 3